MPSTIQPRAMRPSDLRLMPFGKTRPRQVRDGIWEPLWAGRRVLVDVLGDRVVIRDEINDVLEGYEELRASILDCARAEELVLDGYLMPAPLRSSGGAETVPGLDGVPSPAAMGRQMMLGGGSQASEDRRDQIIAERSRRVSLPSASPTAFVAIDLLWIDGQPITDVPLQERKRLLESALDDNLIVRRTVAVREPVAPWFGQWRALGFHEMAVKGANSRYTPGRAGNDWAIGLIPKR